MSDGIFESMGIDPGILIIILFVMVIGLLIFLIVLMTKYNELNVSYRIFMKGRKAESLEEEIGTLFTEIATMKQQTDKNRKDNKKIIDNLRECYQRVGIVKYDAFKEMGGKLSFSVALLNDNETGFIINSIHSSEGCYVYTKEITNGDCAITLGEEEKKALMLAKSAEPFVYD